PDGHCSSDLHELRFGSTHALPRLVARHARPSLQSRSRAHGALHTRKMHTSWSAQSELSTHCKLLAPTEGSSLAASMPSTWLQPAPAIAASASAIVAMRAVI